MTSSSHTGEHTLYTLNSWSTLCESVNDCSSNLSGRKMGGNVGAGTLGKCFVREYLKVRKVNEEDGKFCEAEQGLLGRVETFPHCTRP